jgi:hypothetical protein
MTKTNKLLLIILMSFLLAACSNSTNSQLNLTQYPTQITVGENLTVKGEFLTTNSKDREITIVLNIRELETERGLLTESIDLTDRSQTFSFTGFDLESMDSNLSSGSLYFELKLIINGKFKSKVTTRDNPALLANWHQNIVTTYFNPTKSDGTAAKGTWGNDLTEENPYHFALPYRDFYYYVDDSEDPVRKDYYGVTDVKNRWIEIYYPAADKSVYAQWEDVGPWNYYDPHYVFSTTDQRPYAEMGIDMGWSSDGYRSTNKAGLDISPAAMKYLTGVDNEEPAQGKITVNWRFVSSDQVPKDGPWMEEVSTTSGRPEILNLQTKTLRNLN